MKRSRPAPTVTLTVQLPPILVDVFLAICAEDGDTPQQAMLHAVKKRVSDYLDRVARAQDPASVQRWAGLATLANSLTRAQKRHIFGLDRWPWTDKNAPGSLAEARATAVRRGKREARKEAEFQARYCGKRGAL